MFLYENMNLVDVHCHLNHQKFDEDRDEVVQRAKDAGVKVIITSGVNVPTNREVLELAKKYGIVKCTLGIYPIDALNIKIEALDEVGLTRQAEPFDVDKELEFILSKKKDIVGIGELDAESMELVPGAASALYGPNAFNGILIMNSKSPFEL